MASAEMRAFLDAFAEQPKQGKQGPVDEQRTNLDAFMADQVVPADVLIDDYTLAGRPARKYFQSGVREDASMLYFHGGGYRTGSLDSHHAFTAQLAVSCQTSVNAIAYRLAPEDPYPAGLDDAIAAYKVMLEYTPGEKIMLAGDSAGGGLTLACLLRLRDEGLPMPGCAALLSPHVDLTGRTAAIDGIRDEFEEGARMYAGDLPLDTVGISPLFGEFHDLPPLLIQVAKDEFLAEDSMRLADRAGEAGGNDELQVFDEAFHVFQIFLNIPESHEAIGGISDFYNRHI